MPLNSVNRKIDDRCYAEFDPLEIFFEDMIDKLYTEQVMMDVKRHAHTPVDELCRRNIINALRENFI